MQQLNLFEYWNGFCKLRYIEVGPRRIGYDGRLLSSWRFRCFGENGPVFEEVDTAKPYPQIVEFKQRRFDVIVRDENLQRIMAEEDAKLMAEEDAKIFEILDNIGE